MIDHVSCSSINLAIQCPRAWWAKYVLGKSVPSSEAASFGSQYDTVVSKLIGAKNHKEEKTGEILPGVEEAAQMYMEQDHAFKSATDSQVKINIAPGQWAYMGETLGIPTEISFPITGFIDLLDTNSRSLVDLKTSSSKRTSASWAMQVLIYAIATQANEARIHLMTRTKTPAFYNFMVPVSEDNLRWAMNLFTFYTQQIEKWLNAGAGEELPRQEGFWCSWCPENLECPAKHVILGG
jgi:CRISPR/Cas system-associated exonuclease Cas4 (RecB family)